MNERARSVATGLFAGLVPLLLLDLARVLQEAMYTDPGSTSAWWPVACFVGVGAVAAFGVSAARGDRLVALVGIAVLLLAAVPSVAVTPPAWLPSLPLVTDTFASQAVAFAVAGAYLYALLRGPRA
ncbi:hypothetical protein [Egicoccus halophilus]|uniref:Uncharacterized protein n=1 Tax=Egicoccus halophilus TaxID=1670830 RepID=A0A8J3AAL4_9ACTN|nr:hypothetical protein [Egicoccus halophilus]GGI06572.1 hypothetical protein GCM10011354_19760 [Egicoccus halophilus]